jgi:hypothetical protein
MQGQICRAIGAAFAIALLTPAAAGANSIRYATPTAKAASGDCSAPMPCRIDYAINAASNGDEVVVASGVYTLNAALQADGLDLHGVAGQAPPLLIGADTILDTLLTVDGGSVRHLAVRGPAPDQDTLVLAAGLGEDLEIASLAGDGGKVETSDTVTVLRDSVVVTYGSGSGDAALKLREGNASTPALALRNVTAIAPAAHAIRCEVNATQQATLVNVVARGAASDVNATNGGGGCSASYSNLRPSASPSLALGTGIQSADPLFADAANGDYRPQPASPTVDAGVADAYTGTLDPDGRSRTTPDIGAYECCGSDPWPGDPTFVPPATQGAGNHGEDTSATAPATPVAPVEPPVRGVPAPVLGETVVVAPGQGKVLVRRPGEKRFRELGDATLLPSGAVVDARRGRIRLTTALDEAGKFQTGRVWGSRFQIHQGHNAAGMTSLTLRGGDFGRCPARASRLATASSVARENPTTRRVVRSLWARDRGGRFRTYGNNSVATARGTAWVTRDRCDGTVTRVREGAVAVKNRRTGRTVVVRAGHAYLAKR